MNQKVRRLVRLVVHYVQMDKQYRTIGKQQHYIATIFKFKFVTHVYKVNNDKKLYITLTYQYTHAK